LSIRSLRRWWQLKTGKLETPIDGGVPFWFVSLVFHLVVIIFLARIIMPTEKEKSVNLTVNDPIEEYEDEILPELQFDDLQLDEIGAVGDTGFESVAAQSTITDVVIQDPIELELTEHEVGAIAINDNFFEATAENLSSIAVKGNVGNSVKAASGAVDRLTQEILQSMEERNTVVVWLFDQSASVCVRQQNQQTNPRWANRQSAHD